MSPDYSKYTIQELNDVCNNIDKDNFPKRYEAAKAQLELKQLSQDKALKQREQLFNQHASVSRQISLKSHLIAMIPTGILIFCGLVMWIYFSSQNDAAWDGNLTTLILVWFIVPLIPQAILHLRYWYVNKNYRIEQMGTSISIVANSTSHNFYWEEIETIHLYLPTSQFFAGARYIPSENYSYGKLVLKGLQEEIVITSLLDEDLLWLGRLKPSVIERHWRLFSLV